MKGNPEERAVQLGEYITETGATVRSAAKTFGISKSTVHTDIQKVAGVFLSKNTIFLLGGAAI
ncbi:sporulation transcriptional regulator SpoIIID [Ruthenibacterium lactatiformans]|uniref:sporulation transcriptional regulator SpoIIID n=1 Tax=Ruthenibacterium lactatiformans TaxID=1550024 RepID=UPI003F5CE536